MNCLVGSENSLITYILYFGNIFGDIWRKISCVISSIEAQKPIESEILANIPEYPRTIAIFIVSISEGCKRQSVFQWVHLRFWSQIDHLSLYIIPTLQEKELIVKVLYQHRQNCVASVKEFHLTKQIRRSLVFSYVLLKIMQKLEITEHSSGFKPKEKPVF